MVDTTLLEIHIDATLIKKEKKIFHHIEYQVFYKNNLRKSNIIKYAIGGLDFYLPFSRAFF
jgi:hypothetical protein